MTTERRPTCGEIIEGMVEREFERMKDPKMSAEAKQFIKDQVNYCRAVAAVIDTFKSCRVALAASFNLATWIDNWEALVDALDKTGGK